MLELSSYTGSGSPRSLWLLVVVVCVTVLPGTVTSLCEETAEVCEFWLEIEHKMTMMDYKTAVYPWQGRLYKYDVTNTSNAEPVDPSQVISTDGWEKQRLVVVANGTLPGPAIEVYENQTVIVHVTNKMTSTAVTIHWHGQHQVNTPWMDGVAFVTQCPIQPHASFSYVFKASPRGTFWYHSHIGSQISMGLVGPLIVKDRQAAMEEHVMMVQEWNNQIVADLMHMKMEYGTYDDRQKIGGTAALDGARFSMFPFDSALINGRGRYYYNNGSNNEAPLSTFDVVPGQSYRFRVICASSLYPFRVSVDGHQLSLVASDGYDLDPVSMESIIINPGERYDFVLTANQSADRYWIRAETLEVQVTNHRADAILRYTTAPGGDWVEPQTDRKNCSQDDRCVVVNCPFQYYPADQYTDCITVGELRALHAHPGTPGAPTGNPTGNSGNAASEEKEEEIEDIFLNFGFPGNKSTPSSVNGRAFLHPPSSALTQPFTLDPDTACDPDLCGEEKICACRYTINLEHNKVYNFIFTNMGKGRGWNHPIHMHGHSFHVIKTGYPQYDNQTGRIIGPDNSDINCRGNPVRSQSFCNAATWANTSWGGNNIPGAEFERAPVKDTVQCPTGGYVVVRIRADNPGLWFLHCHVELHAIDGMALMLNESFSLQPKPPKGFPKCGSFQLPDKELVSLLSSPQYRDDQSGDDKSSEITYDKELFWTVVGCLLGVVLLQFLAILVCCCRKTPKKSDNPNPKEAVYSNKAFS